MSSIVVFSRLLTFPKGLNILRKMRWEVTSLIFSEIIWGSVSIAPLCRDNPGRQRLQDSADDDTGEKARACFLRRPFLRSWNADQAGSGDGAIDPKMIEIAGTAAAEGTYLAFSPDLSNIPAAKEFIEKYKAECGELGPYSVYAYVAI